MNINKDSAAWSPAMRELYAMKLCMMSLIVSENGNRPMRGVPLTDLWYGVPLSDLNDETLRAIFEVVRVPKDGGSRQIVEAYVKAQKAVISELKKHGITVHPSLGIAGHNPRPMPLLAASRCGPIPRAQDLSKFHRAPHPFTVPKALKRSPFGKPPLRRSGADTIASSFLLASMATMLASSATRCRIASARAPREDAQGRRRPARTPFRHGRAWAEMGRASGDGNHASRSSGYSPYRSQSCAVGLHSWDRKNAKRR